ncbi:MAG: hypothetical protein IIY01_03540, partial [Clostridia bacterium]|nr:hypothetical protein [Clostridia bacterium]
FVEETKQDTMWDENFPGWNAGNRVVYGDNWVYADFYGANGAFAGGGIFRTSQVIRVPYIKDYTDGIYQYVFEGFDLDGDGVVDAIPATSTVDVSAQAIFTAHCSHSSQSLVTEQDPTCTTDGYGYGVCDHCGEKLEKQILPAKGHDEKILPAVAPTCTEAGLTEGKKCATCGEILEAQKSVAALGHSFGDWILTTSPTCTEKGIETRSCSCGHSETREVAATGHNYANFITAPTCTEQGYTTYTCSCGDSYVDNYVAALGHSFGDWILTTSPTCTEKGIETRSCFCGHSETSSVPALGHAEEILPAVSPTCTEAGLTEGKKCATCGTVLIPQTELPKVPHTYDDQYDATCNVCGYERDAECAHSEVTILEGRPATCIEAGLTEGKKCSKCGEILEAQESIPAKGHDEKILPAVAPTCTETGLTEGKKCATCGTVLIPQMEIPKVPHAYDDQYDATCNVCGYERDAECAHSEVTILEGRPATCTEAGLTEGKKCSKCGEILEAQESIPAKGHAFGEYVSNNDATADADGTKTAVCERCEATDTMVDEGSAFGYAGKFEEAVAALNASDPADRHYTALREALLLWKSLSEQEKAEVAEAYATLSAMVEDYNAKAETANQAMADATEVAFAPVIGSFAFLAALWALLKKRLYL